MWLFTTDGFFSIVQHKDDPDYLLVRARVKGDIENYWPQAEVQRTEDADYLYRAKIPRSHVVAAFTNEIVHAIRYTSFKGALEPKRYPWYKEVSPIMQDMQEAEDTHGENR